MGTPHHDGDWEFESKLLQTVAIHPIIYSVSNKNFHTKRTNDFHWIQVANAIRRPIAECVDKWHDLFQRFLYFTKFEECVSYDFLCSKWCHYKFFKKLQPEMPKSYTELIKLKSGTKKPSSKQTAEHLQLINQIGLRKAELMGCTTKCNRRQELWTEIADVMNVKFPTPQRCIIDWQTIWWELKQNVILANPYGCPSIEINGVLNIYGISSLKDASVEKKLSKNVEFHEDTNSERESLSIDSKGDLLCTKSSSGSNDVQDALRGEWLKLPKGTVCDMCAITIPYCTLTITAWNATAKQLLPKHCRQKEELFVCSGCHQNLNERASHTWKICRVCAKQKRPLDNLLNSSYADVRRVLKTAIGCTIRLSDGLPAFICMECRDDLQDFVRFYLTFSTTQNKLQEIHDKKLICIDSESYGIDSKSSVKRQISQPIRSSKRLKMKEILGHRKDMTESDDERVMKKSPAFVEIESHSGEEDDRLTLTQCYLPSESSVERRRKAQLNDRVKDVGRKTEAVVAEPSKSAKKRSRSVIEHDTDSESESANDTSSDASMKKARETSRTYSKIVRRSLRHQAVKEGGYGRSSEALKSSEAKRGKSNEAEHTETSNALPKTVEHEETRANLQPEIVDEEEDATVDCIDTSQSSQNCDSPEATGAESKISHGEHSEIRSDPVEETLDPPVEASISKPTRKDSKETPKESDKSTENDEEIDIYIVCTNSRSNESSESATAIESGSLVEPVSASGSQETSHARGVSKNPLTDPQTKPVAAKIPIALPLTKEKIQTVGLLEEQKNPKHTTRKLGYSKTSTPNAASKTNLDFTFSDEISITIVGETQVGSQSSKRLETGLEAEKVKQNTADQFLQDLLKGRPGMLTAEVSAVRPVKPATKSSKTNKKDVGDMISDKPSTIPNGNSVNSTNDKQSSEVVVVTRVPGSAGPAGSKETDATENVIEIIPLDDSSTEKPSSSKPRLPEFELILVGGDSPLGDAVPKPYTCLTELEPSPEMQLQTEIALHKTLLIDDDEDDDADDEDVRIVGTSTNQEESTEVRHIQQSSLISSVVDKSFSIDSFLQIGTVFSLNTADQMAEKILHD